MKEDPLLLAELLNSTKYIQAIPDLPIVRLKIFGLYNGEKAI